MDRIEAELLIPGHGAPISDGVVLLDGPRISYAGPAAVAPGSPGAAVTRVATVMPGMWDCHGHLVGARQLDLNQVALTRAGACRTLRAGPARRARRRDYLDPRGGRARHLPGQGRRRGRA